MTPAITALLEALSAALPALLGEGVEIEVRIRIGRAPEVTIAPMPPVDFPGNPPNLPRNPPLVTYYGVQTYGTGDPPANVSGRWYTTDEGGKK